MDGNGMQAAKLAEMSGNAVEHEGSRTTRLKHAATRDAAIVGAASELPRHAPRTRPLAVTRSDDSSAF